MAGSVSHYRLEEEIGRAVPGRHRQGRFASCELGSYPEGHADFPVGGNSWFEAAAYAEFARKSLPTVYHDRQPPPVQEVFMSLENKSTVRRFYDEVLNQGHLHVVDEICAPDFVDHTPAQGQSADRANMKQQVTAWRQAFPDLRVTVEEMIAEAHTIVVRITWEGTHQGPFMGVPATGKRIRSSAVDILHVKQGRVAEGWHYGGDDLRKQLTQ